MKGATAERAVGVWYNAPDRLQPLPLLVHARQRLQQGDRIGMLGVAEEVGGGAPFDDFAQVHHRHLVGHVGDDPQIMGDEHDCHVQLGLQPLHQFEDLGFGGHVQRRGRFIGDQQAGVAGKRHRNHHPLAHPAAELVGEGVHALLRQRNMHMLQHFDGDTFCFGRSYILMQQDILGDLVADTVDRTERGARLLEDHRDLAAANRAHLRSCVGKLQQIHDGALTIFVGPGVEDLAADGVTWGPHHPHDRTGCNALAAAAFAHHSQDLPAADREGSAVYRLSDPLGHKEVGLQVLYFEQRVHQIYFNLCLGTGS